ncbi:MAG: hypothetical protein AAGA91_14090 [Pseudomonadota bacterium]
MTNQRGDGSAGAAAPRPEGPRIRRKRANAEREYARLRRQLLVRVYPRRLLSVYDNLQRVLFVHIPKCGGTSLRGNLVSDLRCLPVPANRGFVVEQCVTFMRRSAEGGTPQRKLLESFTDMDTQGYSVPGYLRTLGAFHALWRPTRTTLLGHQPARTLKRYFRPQRDLLLSVVRDPIDVLRSMVNYRVFHTLLNAHREDSRFLLKSMRMSEQHFRKLASDDPRQLTRALLTEVDFSLAGYLAMDKRTDCDTVWQGLRQHQVILCHIDEQQAMLEQVFGIKLSGQFLNTSDERDGLAATFAGALQDDWLLEHVDKDSVALYQRLSDKGVLGFWRQGGNLSDYRALL